MPDETKPPAPAAEVAPDPEEDDLDDLDDMLDEFAASKIADPKIAEPPTSSTTAAPEPSGPGRPAPAKEEEDPLLGGDEDEFTRQLQAGMAEMLKGLESDPAMAKEFQDMLSQFGQPPAVAGASTQPASGARSAAQTAAPAGSSASKSADASFHETIRQTMERMKESSNTAAASSSALPPGEDAMMAQLMQALAAGVDGEDGDDAFSKMLLGMMEQLTNKDVLYEPMKELHTKFPAWLAANNATLSAADKARYETQQVLVKDIVARFETPGYADTKAEDREYIVEKMQLMQAAGAPPPDLVGDVNAADELFNNADTGCPQQ